jgi:hypothetical protein
MQYLKFQKENALTAFDDLLIAGLTSPRKSIVNTTVNFWNELVMEADASSIDCPDKILDVIKQLSLVAGVRLPHGIELDNDSVSQAY